MKPHRFTPKVPLTRRFPKHPALLCTASILLPCAHAQQREALRSQFLEFKTKAERGDAQSQSNLGLCYAQGRGVTRDNAEAVKWFRKAAEQGYAEAQNFLAVCYARGQGVVQDHAEAVKWYRKAAEQNLAWAQFNCDSGWQSETRGDN